MAFEDESILHNSSTGGVSYASTAPTIETDDGTVTVSKTTLNNIIKTLDEQIKVHDTISILDLQDSVFTPSQQIEVNQRYVELLELLKSMIEKDVNNLTSNF